MSISVLTLLCVYLRYNALYIKLKLFALYNNIFFMKVSKTEKRLNRFSTTENRFSQKTGFNIPNNFTYINKHTHTYTHTHAYLHNYTHIGYIYTNLHVQLI